MKSDVHKVLHPIAGRADARSSARAASTRSAPHRTVIVVGDGREQVEAAVAGARRSRSSCRSRSRAPPMRSARPRRRWPVSTGDVLILYADTPFVTAATMGRMLERLDARRCARRGGASPRAPPTPNIMAASSPRPTARSRRWSNIRMRAPAERALDLCNSGLMAVRAADLWPLLARVGNDNAARRILPSRHRHARRCRRAQIGGDRGRCGRGRGDQQPRRAGRGRGRLAGAPPRRGDGRGRLAGRARDGLVRARHADRPRHAGRAQRRVRPGRQHRRGRDHPRLLPYRGRDDRGAARRSARSPGCVPAPRSAKARGSAISSRSSRRASARAPRPTISPISAMPRSAPAPISARARSPAIMTASSSTRPGSARAPSSAPTPLWSRRSASAPARSSPPAR